MEITIVTELRPCYYTKDGVLKAYKGLFHKWEKYGDAVIAIIETEDGFCKQVRPDQIRFIDNKMEEYNYADSNDKHKD